MEVSKKKHTVCLTCQGAGKRSKGINKKAKLDYSNKIELYNKNPETFKLPQKPQTTFYNCSNCDGTGIILNTESSELINSNLPHIAIIGAGIGGSALAVACLHRGIPFTLIEKDVNFESRSQGYGLTLQQASKIISALGIPTFRNGIISTKHIVYNSNGEILGEWGLRKWINSEKVKTNKHTNIHIPRQELRFELINQLQSCDAIEWGSEFHDLKINNDYSFDISIKQGSNIKTKKVDLIVGCDGIRSSVRNYIINNKTDKLHYLDCMVVLGICNLNDLQKPLHHLLDSETVFQSSNGKKRIYVMPYDAKSVMWQLSFLINENEAIELSKKGKQALKNEALKISSWHSPIPEILNATPVNSISGYPVYDRKLFKQEDFHNNQAITLIGDAAHPMSPFKGQGANQALIDALNLAKSIYKVCKDNSDWKTEGLRMLVLNDFEKEMIERTNPKVLESAKTASILHTETVLEKSNQTRGSIL